MRAPAFVHQARLALRLIAAPPFFSRLPSFPCGSDGQRPGAADSSPAATVALIIGRILKRCRRTSQLNNLAVTYRNLARFAEAEPLYRRAIEVSEKTLRKVHPTVAIW